MEDMYSVDMDALQAVKDLYQKYENVAETGVELIVDAQGCIVPRWGGFPHFLYSPTDMRGMGVHIQDLTYPIDAFEEEVPRTLLYDFDENGVWHLAGLEWYFEPALGSEYSEYDEENLPMLFGVPMDGIMSAHLSFQLDHYDLHGWLWAEDDRNKWGYFNEWNEGMPPQPWLLDVEQTWYASYIPFLDPDWREEQGYVPRGECYVSSQDGDVGFLEVKQSLVGQLDWERPDTAITDSGGMLLGVQWTYPDDGSGPPTHGLIGVPFHGPDEEGNYVFRFWTGARPNPTGMWAPTNKEMFQCSQPQILAACVPDLMQYAE